MTDLAWHAGADGWKPLGEVLGIATQPPPEPTPPEPTPPPTPAAGPPPATPASSGPPPATPAGDSETAAGDVDEIFITRKGQQIGPAPRAKAMELFTAGKLVPTDWGWHDGMDEWKPLYEVLGMEVPAQPAFAPAAAAGKPGKGKKIALIVGIVVLVAGLVFAGITYGPGLYKKIFSGGKIKTEEELGKRAVAAFSKKDYDAFEKLTGISWSKEDWTKLFDELTAEFTEEDWRKMADREGKSVSEMKEFMKEKIEGEFQEAQEKRDRLKEDFEKVLADAEADGVVWSEVEFVSVDTSEVEPMRLPAGKKSSIFKEGDIEVTLSHKGKNYVLLLNDCIFTPSMGWFIEERPRWKGD